MPCGCFEACLGETVGGTRLVKLDPIPQNTAFHSVDKILRSQLALRPFAQQVHEVEVAAGWTLQGTDANLQNLDRRLFRTRGRPFLCMDPSGHRFKFPAAASDESQRY